MHSTTIAGKFQANLQVDLRQIAFPGLRCVGSLRNYVYSSPCRYVMIIGCNLLQELELKIDFKNNNMQWEDVALAIREESDSLGAREAIVLHKLEYNVGMCA